MEKAADYTDGRRGNRPQMAQTNAERDFNLDDQRAAIDARAPTGALLLDTIEILSV
jgi:hypothetical protein